VAASRGSAAALIDEIRQGYAGNVVPAHGLE
jgi:hypothetical protein